MEDELFKVHLTFGLSILIFTFLQHVGGVILKYKYLEGSSGNEKLYFFKSAHLVNNFFKANLISFSFYILKIVLII
jgi:hypothetical protein